MIPSVPSVLMELASVLVRCADPAAPAADRASDLGLSAALLMMAAERWDGEAHRLAEENRALRALLDEAGEDRDLRLSALKAENDRLRHALIQAHAAAEAAGETERVEAIWAEIVAGAERRRLSMAPV